jgi:hypothetical protein
MRPAPAEMLVHPWIQHHTGTADITLSQVRKTPSWPRSWANLSLL